MNLQYLLNNLWYGENSREKNAAHYGVIGAVTTLVRPDTARTWGVDISHWNGLTDLATAKANGCYFVIIKACDGSVPTRWYQENKARAKAAGIPWGCYVWLYPGAKVSISAQAKAWWTLVKDDWPPLGVWVDYEWTSYGGKPANPGPADLQAALDAFQNLSGRKAGVYSAKGYTDGAGMIKNPNNYLWWVAHYGVNNPLLPAGVARWHIHQWTSSMDGSIAPSENLGLDGNYYNGAAAEFAAEYGGATPPPPPGGTMYGKVNTAALNVRNGAGAGYTDLGDLKSGDLVTASEAVSVNGVQWWHLTDATRAGAPVVLTSGITVKAQAAGANDVWASSGNGSYIVETEPPVVTWPDYYMLEDPDGNRQRYNRA